MAVKSREVPPYLKELNNSFNQLTNNGYQIDLSVAFRDVIEYGIQQFSVNTNQELIADLKGRYKTFDKLNATFAEAIKALGKRIGIHQKENGFDVGDGWEWCDVWGTYYEILASRNKKSSFGQFFTPEHICELMARLTIQDKEEKKNIIVNEPCAGSGRMVMAAHCHLKGKGIFYAEDADSICAKMTAINMVTHGITGEVVCHNSLMPETFNFGYHIFRHPYLPIYAIKQITKEESQICNHWKKRKEEHQESYNKGIETRKQNQGKQMKMF
jgi:type I restriction enzyme M protein